MANHRSRKAREDEQRTNQRWWAASGFVERGIEWVPISPHLLGGLCRAPPCSILPCRHYKNRLAQLRPIGPWSQDSPIEAGQVIARPSSQEKVRVSERADSSARRGISATVCLMQGAGPTRRAQIVTPRGCPNLVARRRRLLGRDARNARGWSSVGSWSMHHLRPEMEPSQRITLEDFSMGHAAPRCSRNAGACRGGRSHQPGATRPDRRGAARLARTVHDSGDGCGAGVRAAHIRADHRTDR